MALRHFSYSIDIAAPIGKVFHFHDDVQNLLRVARLPDTLKLKLVRVEGEPGVGRGIHLRLIANIFRSYDLCIRTLEYDPPHRIVSELQSPLYVTCRHTLLCRETPDGTRLSDEIEMERDVFDLVWILHGVFLGPLHLELFLDRQPLTRSILEWEHRRSLGGDR